MNEGERESSVVQWCEIVKRDCQRDASMSSLSLAAGALYDYW